MSASLEDKLWREDVRRELSKRIERSAAAVSGESTEGDD